MALHLNRYSIDVVASLMLKLVTNSYWWIFTALVKDNCNPVKLQKKYVITLQKHLYKKEITNWIYSFHIKIDLLVHYHDNTSQVSHSIIVSTGIVWTETKSHLVDVSFSFFFAQVWYQGHSKVMESNRVYITLSLWYLEKLPLKYKVAEIGNT